MKTNWPVKKLEGNFTQPSPQIKGVPKQEYKTVGKFPVIDQGAVLVSGYTDDEKKVYKRALPVVVFGDHTRNFKFIDFRFVPGADGTKILIPSEEFYPKFFYFALKNLDLESLGYSRHFKILKSQEIPVPPIKEQKRIVAKLEKILSKISEARTIRQDSAKQSETLLLSSLEKLFSASYPTRKLSEFVTFSQLGLVKPKNELSEIGTLYLKMDSILMDGTLDLDKSVKVNATKSEIESFTLQRGDFLFNTRNSPELVGKSGVFSDNKLYLFNNNILRLRFKNVLPAFVNAYFHTSDGKRKLNTLKKGTTSVVAIYQSGLLSIDIPVRPMEEQEKIIGYLDSLSEKVQSLKKLQEEQLGELDALKASILHQAFQGKI